MCKIKEIRDAPTLVIVAEVLRVVSRERFAGRTAAFPFSWIPTFTIQVRKVSVVLIGAISSCAIWISGRCGIARFLGRSQGRDHKAGLGACYHGDIPRT